MHLLGRVYFDLGKYVLARSNLEKLLDCRRCLLPDHPATIHVIMDLALCHRVFGEHHQALALQLEGLETQKRTVPHLRHEICISMNHVAKSYFFLGNTTHAFQIAIDALNIVVELARQSGATSLPGLGRLMSSMVAVVPVFFSKNPAFLPNLEMLINLQIEDMPKDHPDIGTAMRTLGSAYADLGQSEKALALLQNALALLQRAFPKGCAEIAEVLKDLAKTHLQLGNTAKAHEFFQKAMSCLRISAQAPAQLCPPESAQNLHHLSSSSSMSDEEPTYDCDGNDYTYNYSDDDGVDDDGDASDSVGED
jgi:tetratricopeptide (TPR) repeat protein